MIVTYTQRDYKIGDIITFKSAPFGHTGGMAGQLVGLSGTGGGTAVASDASENNTNKTASANKLTNIVTHRIAGISGENFVTKGDANNVIDPDEVTKDQIIGRPILIMPKLGFFLGYVKTPLGLMVFVIIPGTIIIYEEARRAGRELRRLRERRLSARLSSKNC
jgi:hypothetical protein